MGIIPNFMPNPKTAVFPTAVLFYTVNAADAAVDYDASHLWISQPFVLGCIWCILWFPLHIQCFFRGFLHICGTFRRSVAFFKMEKANIEIES